MCQKFINKGEERQRETLTFFPGGTRFWLVLRMCVRAFLMFFSFMLDSTAGGRNSERPHSFLWKKGAQSASSVRPHFQNVESLHLAQTYWMYLSETFWLCLVVMVRMYICRAASRSAASYFSSGPNRSKTTSLQLCERIREQCYVIFPESVSGVFFWRAFHLSIEQLAQQRIPPPVGLKNKLFSNSTVWDSFKGIQSPVPNVGLGSTKWWTLTRSDD